MSKTTTTYWNPLAPDQRARWTPINGLEGMAEEITLSNRSGDRRIHQADPLLAGR